MSPNRLYRRNSDSLILHPVDFTDVRDTTFSSSQHLCFSVSDVEQMRAYLRSKGIAVKPRRGMLSETPKSFRAARFGAKRSTNVVGT